MIEKWIDCKEQMPPEGNCSELIMLWKKCPPNIKHPECWTSYKIGFYLHDCFYDSNYRECMDKDMISHWHPLLQKPIERETQVSYLKENEVDYCKKPCSHLIACSKRLGHLLAPHCHGCQQYEPVHSLNVKK